MHDPTNEQQAILHCFAHTKQNILVDARAGCAKTTTLEMLGQCMVEQRDETPALALAFNVRIKEELEKRFPKNFQVMTMNGLGHRAWGKAIGKRLTVEEKKLGNIITALFRENDVQGPTELWDSTRRLTAAAMMRGLVPQQFPNKSLLPDTEETYYDIAEAEWIEVNPLVVDLARAAVRENIKQAFAGIISYDDQIYMSAMFNGVFPRFPLVLVDEAQDLSPLNHIQVRKAAADRLVVVGDRLQCHPPGTTIYTTGGRYVPIEQLSVGQELASYNSQKTYFPGILTQGRKIEEIRKFDFDGKLVEVTAGNYSHQVTPNHKCLVRFNTRDFYCVYLMRKDAHCRIGVAKAGYNTGFGPAMRARQEGADDVWILTTAQTKREALIQESIITAKYGIPDLMFLNNMSEKAIPQHHLDSVWNQIGKNWLRGKQCLLEYRKDPELPIWEAEGENSHIGFRSFVTAACNLVDGYMDVKVFDGDARCSDWLPLSVSYVPYKGDVYGIQVQPAENGRRLYIAQGIVTHNSIYAFRGADVDSFGKLEALRPSESWTHLSLHTTFRCPHKVVERQQEHAPGFIAFQTNEEGRVVHLRGDPNYGEEGWNWRQVEVLINQLPAKGKPPLVAVVCRNNAPLLGMAFRLIRQGIGCKMLGRDIGKGLIALAKKLVPLDDLPAEECARLIEEWRQGQISLLMANGKEERLAGVEDRAACLQAVLESGVANAGEMRQRLESLFARDVGQVTLATGHRVKGFEYDLVLHLDPWRIPSRHAREHADKGNRAPLSQEMNLKYVIETRTKHTLVMASLENFVQA